MQKIAAAHSQKRIEVWFDDEARFGRQGTLTRVWAPTGSRPTAVRQTQYQYLWVLMAVCPVTGAAQGLISPCLNTGVINTFLKQLSDSLDPAVHAVLIWDEAGFHTANALEVPDNISLLRMPPRSPELMPVENLWHYERENTIGPIANTQTTPPCKPLRARDGELFAWIPTKSKQSVLCPICKSARNK